MNDKEIEMMFRLISPNVLNATNFSLKFIRNLFSITERLYLILARLFRPVVVLLNSGKA